MEELTRRGVPRVPAVIYGDGLVHGWNPEGYAKLVGADYKATTRLSPRELGARLDAILAAAETITRTIPAARMGWKPPERDRTLGDLAFHVFRVALSFTDTMDTGYLAESVFAENAPADLIDGPAVARYGALVRGRVGGWFEGASEAEFRRVANTYYGPQAAHEFLERTTWHCAQHLRQLHVLFDRLGLRPPAPLDETLLDRLPLPESIW
jgi:DinB family protein